MELGSRDLHAAASRSCPQICPVATLCAANRAAGRQGGDSGCLARKCLSTKSCREAAVVVRTQRRRSATCVVNAGKMNAGPACGTSRDSRWTGDSTIRFATKLAHQVRQMTGLSVKPGPQLTTIRHGVTRFRITLVCHEANVVSGRLHRGCDLKWVRRGALDDHPLSVTGRKLSRLAFAAAKSRSRTV